MRIYSLFGTWDSPSITRFPPMAHSPVSWYVQVKIYAIPGASLAGEINVR